MICILEFRRKKMHKYVWASFLLLPNSTLLHISFPRRQTTWARDFNFFHRKANKISYSLVYSLSIINKTGWVNIHRKCTELCVNNKIIASARNVNLSFVHQFQRAVFPIYTLFSRIPFFLVNFNHFLIKSHKPDLFNYMINGLARNF